MKQQTKVHFILPFAIFLLLFSQKIIAQCGDNTFNGSCSTTHYNFTLPETNQLCGGYPCSLVMNNEDCGLVASAYGPAHLDEGTTHTHPHIDEGTTHTEEGTDEIVYWIINWCVFTNINDATPITLPFVDLDGDNVFGDPYDVEVRGDSIFTIFPDSEPAFLAISTGLMKYGKKAELASFSSDLTFFTPNSVDLKGQITTCENRSISNVAISFSNNDQVYKSNDDGSFSIENMQIDASTSITLEKDDNMTNGVSVMDMVLIHKHITGKTPFTKDCQLIAADVNQSGTITSWDIVNLRQLILGMTLEHPIPSWVFPVNNVPIQSFADLNDLNFTGIKIGDLNNSATPNNLHSAEDRSGHTFTIKTTDKTVKANELVAVQFTAQELETILGFQFTLKYDENALELVDLKDISLSNMDKTHFNLNQSGNIAVSWYDLNVQKQEQLFSLQFKAKKGGKLSDWLVINSKLTKAEAYSHHEDLMNVQLNFENQNKSSFKDFKMYPNPIKGDGLKVSFYLTHKKEVSLSLTNVNGQIIQQIKYQPQIIGEQQIDYPLNNIPSGVYWLAIETDNQKFGNQKLVRF